MTARMVQRARQSLPKQCDDWAELKAVYRLLSNPQVRPEALGEPINDWEDVSRLIDF